MLIWRKTKKSIPSKTTHSISKVKILCLLIGSNWYDIRVGIENWIPFICLHLDSESINVLAPRYLLRDWNKEFDDFV